MTNPALAHFSETKPAHERPETAQNLLGVYFKEVAALPVLKPNEEFEMAKNLELLEVRMWKAVFSYPRLLDHLLTFVQKELEPHLLQGLKQLTQAAAGCSTRSTLAARRRYGRLAERVAQQIRAIDVDQKVLNAVLDELGALSNGGEPGGPRKGQRFSPHSKRFGDYHTHVLGCTAAAQRARNNFVRANLRLVMTIARRYNHGQIPFQDLIQEGNIGLIKAVGRFEHGRGYRFSTYASWWIRHSITRAIADKGRMVRVPVHILSSYNKVARTSNELSGKLGRQPTHEEISSCTDICAEKVDEAINNLSNQSLSLDHAISHTDSRRFIDLMADDHTPSPSSRLLNEQMFAQVEQILQDLTPMEVDVLQQRFGLRDGKVHTLNEIGSHFSLSRERIRQIQEKALEKIRQMLQRRNAV